MRATVVAAVAACALLLSACSGAPEPTEPSTPPASAIVSKPTGEKVPAAVARYYHQVLQWTGCSTGLECTKASVPLDWSHPTRGAISIALVRQPALSGTSKGSLLIDPGGPGASGVDFVEQDLGGADLTLQQNYDIVGFDPRGVGHSTEVTCYSGAQLSRYYYDTKPGTIGSTAWVAADVKQQSAFAKACAKNTGALLGHVDTISAARDMDVLRAALGDAKLNYLGYSYGTKLGLEYAGLFPKKVGRFVLDSVLDPNVSGEDFDIDQAQGWEDELQQYLAACLPDPKTCPFTGTIAQGDAELTALFASVEATPLRNKDGRLLNASNLGLAVIQGLYAPQLWPSMSMALKATMKRSAGPAFALADEYNDLQGNGQYSNSTEAYYAVMCLDESFPDKPAAMRGEATILDTVAPVMGPYFAYQNTTCGSWAYPRKVKSAPIVAKGSGPILLLSATHDPATPHQWAEDVAKTLDNGHLITRVGNGHGSYNQGNACIDTTVDNYFVDGTVPAADPMC